MSLEEALALKFVPCNNYRPGKTIREWVDREIWGLLSYGLRPEMNPDGNGRIFRAYVVILIIERRVLFAEARLSA